MLLDYFRAMGLYAALASVVLMVFYQSLSVYSMFWLTFWTEDPYLKNRTNAVLNTVDNITEYNPEYTLTSKYYLTVYALMVIVQGNFLQTIISRIYT